MTLVPESESGPHMAKLGEDRYYKRSGDTFYKMEHFDLEDMFGRRKKPKLRFTTRIDQRGVNTSIFVGIENVGRGAAKAPYLAFNINELFRPSPHGLDGNGHDGLPKLHYGQDLRFRYGANLNFVIHPGTTHEVTKLDLGMYPRLELLPDEDIVIEYEISKICNLSGGGVNLGRIAIN